MRGDLLVRVPPGDQAENLLLTLAQLDLGRPVTADEHVHDAPGQLGVQVKREVLEAFEAGTLWGGRNAHDFNERWLESNLGQPGCEGGIRPLLKE